MRSRIMLVAAVVALGFAGAAQAGAQGGGAAARLTTIQAAAHTAIANRLTALSAATTEVASLSDLGADQQALTARLAAATSGLIALEGTIQADTTAASAKADARTVVTAYRVYALVLPAAYMTAAADRLGNEAVPRLQALSTKLGAAITAANAASLQPKLTDLHNQVAAAAALTAGLPATLAALTPADFNANPSVVATNRQKLVAARGDLRAASADAHAIINSLTHG